MVSLPFMGIMWVLSVLSASENSQIFSISLSACVLAHAIFSIVGYCIINKRVRENLNNTFLRCMGKKVPLLDSNLVVSSSSSGNTRTPGFNGNFDGSRRNIGISVSSTTSRSTAKTSSSPYRSDGQLRHTSTSTSNYNSDVPSFMKGYETGRKKEGKRRQRRDSESGSDTDGRSLDLASSHSSDDEESRVGRSSTNTHRSTGVSAAPSYLPNITEHVATTPPELHVVQSPQLFPNVKSNFGGRWSSQAPESYLPTPNIGRWSQETGSDNEMHSHKTSSPNPLPNPDITDTSYLQQHQNKMNMPPSILENIQETYNMVPQNAHMQHDMYSLTRKKDYQDNYRDYDPNYQTNLPYLPSETTQIVNHMRPYHQEQPNFYDKSRTLGYLGSKSSSPYMSKERVDMYSPREHYSTMKNGNGGYMQNNHSVQSLIRNDYQVN